MCKEEKELTKVVILKRILFIALLFIFIFLFDEILVTFSNYIEF